MFELKITIPHIDELTIPQFEKEFHNYSFIKNYWKSFVFPNKVDYTFSHLNEVGVKNMLEKLTLLCNQIFEEEYKTYIRYSIKEREENI